MNKSFLLFLLSFWLQGWRYFVDSYRS